jgi:uncharacterized repeat protein (TIGR03843 family)
MLELTAVEGRMPYASNATLLATSEDGRRWIYKPEEGESPLSDFPWRSLAAREVLTYEVATALGLDIVPETVLANGPHGRGSAQVFVAEDFEFDPRTLFSPRPSPRLWPVAVLDIICNNADRKLGHIIRQMGGDRLWAIDNGLTFHSDPKLRTVLWGFAGAEIPAPLIEALEKLRSSTTPDLVGRVADLLTGKEAEAFRQRVEELAARPVHPLPPEDRPALPWPVF